jgi:hypothetical protein
VLSGFGLIAAVLATVGLTGLFSLVVALRQRELGIRAALGATPARLRRHVATEGLLEPHDSELKSSMLLYLSAITARRRPPC